MSYTPKHPLDEFRFVAPTKDQSDRIRKIHGAIMKCAVIICDCADDSDARRQALVALREAKAHSAHGILYRDRREVQEPIRTLNTEPQDEETQDGE